MSTAIRPPLVSAVMLRYGLVFLGIGLGLLLVWPGLWENLFSSDGFMSHGHCYMWLPSLVRLHVSSDLIIGLSYVSISATLALLVHRARRAIPFSWMIIAFGLFIVACGATHLMEVWTLWNATYWLSGYIKLITAVVSIATAIALPPLVPKTLALIETARLSEERKLRLEEANQELRGLYQKITELDQLKTDFFANISHELRTPLALIQGPTEKLLESATLTAPERGQLHTIERNVRTLRKHVNDLLDVAKLEAGKMEVRYQQLDLSRLCNLVAGHFESLAVERNIKFSLSVPDSLVVRADGEKLQRVILNLLSNAFKFTPEGGTVKCSLSRAPGGGARLDVEDSGPGIPADERQAIFERFRQLSGGNTRRFGGTGLGLAIAKEFVELHAGKIAVGETPLGGARLTVEIPDGDTSVATGSESPANSFDEELIDAEPYLPRPAEAKTDGRRGATENSPAVRDDAPLILVVEDNPEMNRFIVETLAADYRVESAADGREGLERTLALKPDLVITDLMMPNMGGDELVEEMRRRGLIPETPVLVLTAKTDDEARAELLSGGAQDYLIKPFALAELRARAGNLVKTARARSFLREELKSQQEDLGELAREVKLRRQELEETLRERNLLLQSEQKARRTAEEANRLKDEFLATVSHELRTPLTAMIGWVHLLRDPSLDEATAKRAIESIDRNSKAQAQIVDDLLDTSRIITGKLRLHVTRVPLRGVVEAALDAVRFAAQAKNIDVSFDSPDDEEEGELLAVAGDQERLQQVAWNLLSNAVKFTGQNGRVEVKIKRDGESGVIEISDDGEGIEPSFLPFVFDRFRQADGTTTRQHGGLGLGLSIVRHLVELHGGTVEAESAGAGRGATFRVRLPIEESK